MKLFFLDLETTGVKYWKNGIHQISGCIEVDGIVKEYFDFKVQPHPLCTIEDEALAVSNLTKEVVLAYTPMKEVYTKLILMLARYVDKYNKTDKYFIVGYNNASFDNAFLREFFIHNASTETERMYGNYFGSWFWSNSLDVMVLASEKLKELRYRMLDFKLKTVAKQLGISVDDTRLHDAAYDIELTRQVYYASTRQIDCSDLL